MQDVIKSELFWSPHDETMTHRTTQPTEGLILYRNKELRDHDLMGDLSFGRQIASIPQIAWEAAIRKGYDMANPDGKVAEREIHRFLQSDYGKLCLVRARRQKYFKGGLS